MLITDTSEKINFLKTLLIELEISIENESELLNLNFKKLESWSSMKSLLMVVEIEDKFGVLLTGEEVKNAQTFADIFETVNRSKNESSN